MKKLGKLVGVCNCYCHCSLKYKECISEHDSSCEHCKKMKSNQPVQPASIKYAKINTDAIGSTTEFKVNQPVSDCCKSSLYVFSTDEGTSYYVCSKCNKDCDPYMGYPNHYNDQIAMVEASKSMQKESESTQNWENLYPLNTFTGKTKEELVDFILQRQKEAVIDFANHLITENKRSRKNI